MDRARVTQRTYDRIAAQFLARNRSASGLEPWMVRFKACLPGQGAVIDLGAGPCHDSAALRALGLSVISLDRSRAMLRVARDELPGPRVQGDMRHLPFRKGSIDGIWASASLLHLDRAELPDTLRAIREVLRPSGALFLSLKEGSGQRWETAKYGPEAPRWFVYWTAAEVDAVLHAAGFEVVEAASAAGQYDNWILRLAKAAGSSGDCDS